MSVFISLGYSQIVESTAISYSSDDGKMKPRLGFSSLDTKLCLIATKILTDKTEEKEESSCATSSAAAETSAADSGKLLATCKVLESSSSSKMIDDPNWVFFRTKSDGSKIFISVSSAAKRLFKTREEIIASCSKGLFLDLYAQESGLLFNRNYKKVSPSLTIDPAAIDYLNRNKEGLIDLARKSESGYIYEKFRAFPRPVEVRSDGSILVHFTKTLVKSGNLGKGDLCFGQGSFKKARAAVFFNGPNAGAMKLITTFNVSKYKKSNLNADHETYIHAKLSGKPGILNLYREYKVIGSNNCVKSFMDLEFCEHGELFELVNNSKLMLKDKVSIILDLLDGMVSLQEAGIVHRDIKLENVFLRKKDGRLRAKIGDFGLSCEVNDTIRKKNSVGSPEYVDPVYLKAALEKNVGLIEELTTHKLDMYSLGIALYVLNNTDYFKGKLPEKTLSIDEDPLSYLICDCLETNQDVRIDARTAHDKYYAKFQSILEKLK